MLPIWIKKPVEARMYRRRQSRAFEYLDPKGAGLEIGPCHNGLAPKREGFRVQILDHLDQEGLRRKYKDHVAVDLDKIEPVDHVWSGEPYPQLMAGASFDWIIASHVVEHVPDLIRFLNECGEILAEGGRLLLVVPDARRGFDRFRYPSGSGEVVDAHLRGDLRPTPGAVAEHHLRACTKGGRHAWPVWWPGRFRRIHSDKEIIEAFEAACRQEYRDVHVWRFTPESFARLMDDLTRLGRSSLELVAPPQASGLDFTVCLRRKP